MKNFEERLVRLEELVTAIKSSETPLSEAIAQFEEGFKLAQSLEKDLEKMEKRVEILLNPQAVQQGNDVSKDAHFELFNDLPS